MSGRLDTHPNFDALHLCARVSVSPNEALHRLHMNYAGCVVVNPTLPAGAHALLNFQGALPK
jgi:hypothetical protein